MKEVYPHSSIWPYVMSGLLLFGLVLAPPTEWPQTARDIYVWTKSFEEPKQPLVDPNQERIFVEFDTGPAPPPNVRIPRWNPDTRIASAADSEDLPLVDPKPLPPETNSIDLADVQRPVAQDTMVLTAPIRDVEHGSTIIANTSPAVTREAPRHVWQPPANWIPRPFQPLSEAPAVATIDQNQPLMADIMPPVADRNTTIDTKLEVEVGPQLHPARLDPNQSPPQPESLSSAPESSGQPIGDVHQDSIREESRIEGEFWSQDPFDIGSPEEVPEADEPESPIQTPQPDAAQLVDENSGRFEADVWPRATQLHSMLDEASRDVVLTNWVSLIRDALGVLEANRVSGMPDQVKALQRLEELARLQVDRSRWPLHHRILHDRVKLALMRRVLVWRPLMVVAHQETTSFAVHRSQGNLAAVTSRLERALSQYETTHGIATQGWSGYLGLAYFRDFQQLNADQWLQLSEDVLERLYTQDLSAAQLQLLREPMFDELKHGLRSVLAQSIHPADVMAALETYEVEPNRQNADRVLSLLSRWRSAPSSETYDKSLEMITKLYRNANLRYSVSQELINRFVPAYQNFAEQVNDRILGAEVRGRNTTATNFRVKLIPDPHHIRIGLLASGQIQSNTSSRKGPVLLFNQGQSRFSTGKELIVKPDGIFVTPAGTQATTASRVTGMRTQWDGVPFFGWVVRNIARQQHDEQKPQVRREILRRVRQGANQRVDAVVNPRVTSAEETIKNRLVSPLRELRLDPQAMEMRTTQNRVIMRGRIASAQQFGAHTPRPAARADSLMSFQLHQTAANNMIEQLELHGERMTLAELCQRLSDRLSVSIEVPNQEHRDTVLQFADHHPLEAHFDNGRISITIHFAELDNGKRNWKNFSVRGNYLADVRHLDIELVREEGVELIGERIGLRDQLALRSIFTKIFAKNTRLKMLREAIQKQPQLQNLVVSQFEIRDGWLGLALGESASETNGETSHITTRPVNGRR